MDAKPHKQMREGLCGEKRSEWENRVPETCHPGVKSPGTGCGQAAPRRSRAKEKRGLAPQSAANPLPGSGEKEESEKLKSGYARIGVPNQFCLFFGVTCVFFWGVAGVFFWGVACVFFVVRKQQSRAKALFGQPWAVGLGLLLALGFLSLGFRVWAYSF